MQKVFSLNELIAASENKLTIHTVKDYCRRGELHPCIYFEGNIVCIHEERFQDSIDKSDPVTHIETVSWARKFKGYISASNFIDYITYKDPNTSDVFFNIGKIIEQISSVNEHPTLKSNEYLKAFPPKIDDDIKEIRWLLEIQHFTGNVFRADEIVFHISEVKKILMPDKDINQIKNLDYSDKPFLRQILHNEYFSPIQAACLMSQDDPDVIELLYEKKNQKYILNYPKNYNALTLILRAIEMGILDTVSSTQISKLTLAEFLVTRGYIIENFNTMHYKGSYGPYRLSWEGKKVRDKPEVLNFAIVEDPLSEINYLRFKVDKQNIELEQLKLLSNTISRTDEVKVDKMVNLIKPNQYSTAALEAVKGVIQEFWIYYDPKIDIAPKQSTVMDWIGNTYSEFSNNDYMKKSIDKICRHPTAKLGGNSKVELESKKKTSKQ